MTTKDLDNASFAARMRRKRSGDPAPDCPHDSMDRDLMDELWICNRCGQRWTAEQLETMPRAQLDALRAQVDASAVVGARDYGAVASNVPGVRAAQAQIKSDAIGVIVQVELEDYAPPDTLRQVERALAAIAPNGAEIEVQRAPPRSDDWVGTIREAARALRTEGDDF